MFVRRIKIIKQNIQAISKTYFFAAMITVDVSGPDFDLKKLMTLFLNCKISTRVVQTVNTVENPDTNLWRVEPGATITFYDILPEDFHDHVWQHVENEFNFLCAFVDSAKYRGCIRDWPRIYTSSNCPGDKNGQFLK